MTRKEYDWTWISVVLIFLIIFLIGLELNNNPNLKNETNSLESGYYNEKLKLNTDNVIKIRDNYSDVDKVHWSHMPIKYNMTDNCYNHQEKRILDAFDRIENETDGLVYFKESNDAEFYIICGGIGYNSDSTVSTIAEAIFLTYPENENIFSEAAIYFYGQGMSCGTGYPAVEVHEILHNFGFDHNSLMGSIMAPYSEDSSNDCEIKEIDDVYIECLKYIYTNATIGNCNGVSKNVYGEGTGFINNTVEMEFACEEGTYESTNDPDSCCPEPSMWTDEYYCYYS